MPVTHLGTLECDSAAAPRRRARSFVVPDVDLSHAKLMSRYEHEELPVVDPLRMLAVAVLTVARDDLRRGLSVEMGIEWVEALDVPAEWVAGLGVQVLVYDERSRRYRHPRTGAYVSTAIAATDSVGRRRRKVHGRRRRRQLRIPLRVERAAA